MRRFGLQTMRNLGVGRAALERQVGQGREWLPNPFQFLSDISGLISRLRKEVLAEGRKELFLQRHIDRLIGSVINRVLFGHAFNDVRSLSTAKTRQIY